MQSNKKNRILIIDEVHPVLLEILQNCELDYRPSITPSEVREIIGAYQGVIVRSKLRLDSQILSEAAHLEFIGRLGSGMDNIDEIVASNRGIQLFNAPEGNCVAVAEQTIGMLLSLLANIQKSSFEVKQGIWDRKGNSGVELNALSIGIIGYGHVGSTLAKLLLPFGCKILVYDKFKSGFGSNQIQEVTLEKLQECSDAISIHIPLSKENTYFVNSSFIEAMHKPFYLLNLSRGKVLNTKDMIAGIRSGKILGCALDVLENENITALDANELEDFKSLVNNPKVIITPHIGGLTQNSFYKLSEILGKKIKDWLELQPFVNQTLDLGK